MKGSPFGRRSKMRKRLLGILLAASLLSVPLWLQATPRLHAEEEGLSKQVGQVLKNQEKILRDLGEIKAELAKIRMRVH